MMKSFCRQMKSLYGVRSATINIHNLSHLETQINTMGPLWSHSAFSFEAKIAHTLRNFKGTKGVADQIAINYLIEQEIYPLKLRLESSDAIPEAIVLSDNLSQSKPKSSWRKVSGTGVYFSGPSVRRQFTNDERIAVNAFSANDLQQYVPINVNEEGHFMERMKIKDAVFHSICYKQRGKSCSFIVQYAKMPHHNEDQYGYGEVHVFVNIRFLCMAIVKPMITVRTSICSHNINPPTDHVAMLLASHHVPIGGPPEPTAIAIPCDSIIAKCIEVNMNDL